MTPTPRLAAFWLVALLLLARLGFAAAPTEMAPLGLGLGGFNDWTSTPFANTMLTSRDWQRSTSSNWGSPALYFRSDGTRDPQFDVNGYPQFVNQGELLRALMWPFGMGPTKPAGWPSRIDTGLGIWTVTWKGRADIRLNNAQFVSGNGSSTGMLTDGRRVYRLSAPFDNNYLEVSAVDPANPITDIKVWLPDPADPQQQSLEGHFWHPAFLRTIEGMNHLRFMDWGHTNSSPQRDWVDRRLPGHRHQLGVLNRRAAANNRETERRTGIAYELMVRLCNDTQKDMWVCVPHMATDDYVTKLAQLIRYGSDGVMPYTSPQANPVYPPLDPNLRVWVEYSNEVWQPGNNHPDFRQGEWVAQQGLPKNVFVGRRVAQIFRLFQNVFGGHERVVRVAGLFTANSTYNTQMLTELRNHGAGLTPAVTADVAAPTTYFGNGIQDWAQEQARRNFNSSTPWFLTANSSGQPVSVGTSHTYWTSTRFEQQKLAAFAEWKRRLFSGSSAQGGGPDATGTLGGFDSGLSDLVQGIFGTRKPLVAYEGGPSLYTNEIPDNAGVTNFIESLNRHPGFAEIYRAQLNAAFAKGLASNTLFVDVSRWANFGQWGHLEYMDQPLDQAVKWMAVTQTAADLATLRSVHSPLGSVPQFATPAQLPLATYLQPYSQDIVVSGGNYSAGAGPRIVEIASLLAPGLTSAPVPGDPYRWRVSGTPTSGGANYLYLRVNDSDGDPSWRIFSLQVAGGPGVLVESDFRGAFSGASNLPWTKAHSVDSRLTFSGWDIGATFSSTGGTALSGDEGTDGRGVRLHAGTDGLRFSVSQGTSSPNNSTLASAITDREDWKFTITPKAGQSLDLRQAEFRMNWTRLTYHAPRHLAVFSSIGGFAENQKLFETSSTASDGTVGEVVFELPNTAAYANITSAVEFRVVFFRSQYSHHAQILDFKLTAPAMAVTPPPTFAQWIEGLPQPPPVGQRGPTDDPDGDGLPNLLEFALGRSPTAAESAPALATQTAASLLTVTYLRAQPQLTYVVETSSSLAPGDWTSAGVTQQHAVQGEMVTAAVPLSSGEGARRFLRLRVTQP